MPSCCLLELRIRETAMKYRLCAQERSFIGDSTNKIFVKNTCSHRGPHFHARWRAGIATVYFGRKLYYAKKRTQDVVAPAILQEEYPVVLHQEPLWSALKPAGLQQAYLNISAMQAAMPPPLPPPEACEARRRDRRVNREAVVLRCSAPPSHPPLPPTPTLPPHPAPSRATRSPHASHCRCGLLLMRISQQQPPSCRWRRLQDANHP
jgi:hypothetical protein